jgi:spermidine synthase
MVVSVLAAFFASGFAALLYQIVWQRMLGIFSGADV